MSGGPDDRYKRLNGREHGVAGGFVADEQPVYQPTQKALALDSNAEPPLPIRFSNPVTFVSRLRLDAALHAPPGPQPKSKPGPKPKKGKRLPSLAERLVNPTTKWTRQHIDWYGGRQRLIEYVTGTALWYTPGYDPLPIRWVLVRDPLGEFEATAFFATDQSADPLQILNWFIMRWGLGCV